MREQPTKSDDPEISPIDQAALLFAELAELTRNDVSERWDEVKQELLSTGTYSQTTEELTWAARIAWRNSEKCIARLSWKKLEVLDFRDAKSADAIFDGCVEHITKSTNQGRIRPYLSVFPQGAKIHNTQLLLYAGYHQTDGSILGDPAQVELTQQAIKLGWKPPVSKSAFDILPLLIEFPGEEIQVFELPKSAILEVGLESEHLPWFKELGLRWFALPAVSSKTFMAGGVNYSCAPFSGFYMGTEIGARNLTDKDRYNILPTVAEKMGLEVCNPDRLWKDRAFLEINAAVLYSFRKNNVRIINHHEASKQFMQHQEKEAKHGRTVPADWSWIIPPMSSSLCPVFHQYYDESIRCPRYD